MGKYKQGEISPCFIFEIKPSCFSYYDIIAYMVKDEQGKNKSDNELVALTLKDEENFLFLIKRYEDKLTRYIRRISNFSPEKSEDVLQEIFIKAYRSLNNFDKDLKFSSWLYRIAHNTVISEYRKEKSRPEYFLGEKNDKILDSLKSDLDLAREVDLRYLKKSIYKILNSMDRKYEEALVLKFFEDKDYKEISDILKKPMGTVATLISRAKKQFKEKVKELEIEM